MIKYYFKTVTKLILKASYLWVCLPKANGYTAVSQVLPWR